MPVRAAAFLACLALSVGLPSRGVGADAAARLDMKGAFWLQAGLLAAWLGALVLRLKSLPRTRVTPRARLAAAASLALMAAAFMVCPKGLKVLMDEVQLASVARGFYDLRQPYVCSSAETGEGGRECLEGGFDKRPRLFPFLLSLLHVPFGPGEGDVLLLNFLAGWAALVLTGALAARVAGPAASLAAPMLLFTMPLYAHAFTGGGFEPLQLALLLACARLWVKWDEEASPGVWPLLVATHALLGHVRYEGFAYVLIGAPVVVRRWRSPSHRRDLLGWWTALSPLALLPLLLHWKAMGFDVNWAHGQQTFSPGTFLDNSRHNLRFLFVPSVWVPNSPGLAALALAGLAWGCWRTAAGEVLAVLFAVCWVVTSSYEVGNLLYPNSYRYALPLGPPLAAAACAALARLEAWRRGPGRLSWALAAALLVWGGSSLGRERGLEALLYRKERRAALEFLKTQPRRSLAIYPWAQGFILDGWDAWSVAYASKQGERLRQRLASGRYEKAFLFWSTDCQWDEGGRPIDPAVTHGPMAGFCRQAAGGLALREAARLRLQRKREMPVYELVGP